ncbi:hypothetical protein D9615_005875 [Tricholomella constricta]|uniref:Chromo domain-containing protein n=1 Tax=Tricholomella constricta TaxID=117010 RepID=A0A8H5H999_9AGAR|nr:hypothetical protein D9615_005875 [Tricholomella constricta]
MSGSRRRMNLNLTVDPPSTPRPQVSQPQSATVQYHYQPSSDNLVPHHRPATIPYAQQTSSWLSTHAQPTPYLLQQAPYYATLPTSNAATPMPMPNPAANDYLVDRFITAITPLLSTHQQSTSARIDQIEVVLEELSSHVKQVNVDAQAQTKQLAEAMQKAFLTQQAGGKALNSRMEKLEKAIKSSFDRDDPKSLLNRLETISFGVEELLERAKDAQADQFLPTATAVVPSKQYADASQNPIQHTPSPQPTLVDRATSTVLQVYTDTAIGSDAPMPATPHQQTPSLRRDFATSPVRHAYSSKGMDGRTPDPPETPRRFMSAGVATSPTTELPRLSMVSSHRHSSDALTLVGDTTCPENRSTVDLNELGVSPRLKRKRTKVAHMSGDEGDIEMEHVEGAQGNTVLDNENSDIQKDLKMSSHFTSSPAISRSLSAADWSDGAPHNAASDEGSNNDSALLAFRPATSPSVAKRYSILKGERNPFDDGTVASLRHDALGGTHAGPKPLSPQLPIQPFCPRPSISPLPSPVSSPSPPPASVGRRPKFSKTSDVGASPVRRTPFVVSSPSREAARSSLVREESASSPAQEVYLGKLAYDASVSSPGHTPQEISSADLQSTPYVPTDDLIPDSELSVARMITETFESLEQLHAEVPEVGHPPLFLPDPESHSPSPQPAYDVGSPPRTPKQRSKAPQRRIISSSPSPIATPKTFSPVIISSINRNTQNTKDLRTIAIKKPLLAKLKPPATFASIPIPAAYPNSPPLKEVYVSSSPIYISSRSPSPLSELSESEPGSDSDPDVRIIPPKKKKPRKGKAKVEPVATPHMSTMKAPRVDLKNKLLKFKTQDGQSAAVTRVKKRKVKESKLEAMEPPLKRARQKLEDEEEEWRGNGKRPRKVAAEVAARSGKGKEKEKEKKGSGSKEKSGTPASSTSKGVTGRLRQRAPPTGCKWPTKNMTADKKFDQQFVECFLWYHYGCVGIIDLKDVRIKGGELFTCPPCSAGGANPMVASKNIVCARPDCGQEEKRSDEYFMTGIVGRSTKIQGGKGKRYIWLVKWDGYSIKDCTWEEEDGMSDPQSFIQDFNEAASLEGFDPEADQHSTILLQEAFKGGWKDPNA